MNGTTTVTLQPRGQITLPQKYRDHLELDGGAILKVSLRGRGMFVEPLAEPADSNVTKPTISGQEYLKALEKIVKSGKVLWTKDDDRRRAESLKKETEKWKRLNW